MTTKTTQSSHGASLPSSLNMDLGKTQGKHKSRFAKNGSKITVFFESFANPFLMLYVLLLGVSQPIEVAYFEQKRENRTLLQERKKNS